MKSLPKDHQSKIPPRTRAVKPGAGEKEEWLLLKSALKEFRDSGRRLAEKPDSFWENQRQRVLARYARHSPVWHQRLIWAWAVALFVLALGAIVLVERQKPVKPDFAVGYDQQLLLDIDRTLAREGPAALEAGALLPEEIFPSARILAAP